MQMHKTFLTSKVARRVFALFITSALVPILVLAIISFRQVNEQLYEQGKRRLHHSNDALSMSIYERLLFLENELKLFSSSISPNSQTIGYKATEEYDSHLKERFKMLAFVTASGECVPLFGVPTGLMETSNEGKQHLQSGQTVLATKFGENNQVHIYMMREVNPEETRHGVLCGEINSMYLWGLTEENSLPSMTELCVLDEHNNIIFSSIPLDTSFFEKSPTMTGYSSSSGHFGWKAGETEYLAHYRDIFTKPRFLYPRWTTVLSMPEDYIFSPLAYFKKIFPLVILLSFWVVLFLSVFQIRRIMDPLEKLKDGTRQIAMRDFDSRVNIASNDEFEELASSFNDMAHHLGRQFNALTTMAEIDRAILSSLDKERIIDTVITRMHEYFKYEFVGVILLDSRGKNHSQFSIETEKGNRINKRSDIEITIEDLEDIIDGKKIVVKNVKEALPPYLTAFAEDGIRLFIILPLFIKQRLAGIITLGSLDSSVPDQEDLEQAQRLANQVAVALSNAQLIEELALLNWGTLTALARAVDAKSPWTAGHSERVTEKALEVGKVVGLTHEELENLHRGGLLHDIGKIGIPASILDKVGKLTDEEYEIIKGHSRTGARILEPIAAYEQVVPIVLQHHEHFDGTGYPDGLSGEEISFGGRILAVVDVFDALISDRPYRKGMELETVLKIIREESGKQFDPKVVQAFLKTF
jgi:putative nucleotidyltransferase with HDIG domain